MNPVFNDYCKFLKDTAGLNLQEGYYWLDKQIIKAYDRDGNIHKLYRLIINDEDLTISYKIPKLYDKISDFEIADWNDTIKLNKNHLEEIEKEALIFIKDRMKLYGGVFSINSCKYGEGLPGSLLSGKEVIS